MTTDVDVLRQGPAAWAQYVAERRGDDSAWTAALRNAELRGADLCGADLREADLCGADLREADLRDANIYGAMLHSADLREANLQGARIHGACLRRADLREADLPKVGLYGADLRKAYLRGADLREADLGDADLRGADLRETDLRDARYSPMQMLRAYWGEVSDDLCVQLMALDAEVLPDGIERMDEWARGGRCPYSGTAIPRVANFRQDRRLWPIGGPDDWWTIWEIWERLAAEKGILI